MRTNFIVTERVSVPACIFNIFTLRIQYVIMNFVSKEYFWISKKFTFNVIFNKINSMQYSIKLIQCNI